MEILLQQIINGLILVGSFLLATAPALLAQAATGAAAQVRASQHNRVENA